MDLNGEFKRLNKLKRTERDTDNKHSRDNKGKQVGAQLREASIMTQGEVKLNTNQDRATVSKIKQ